MKHTLAVFVIFSLAWSGCGNPGTSSSNVRYVSGDDARMNAAIEKARSSVKTFIAALTAPQDGQSSFGIKVAFTDGSQTEHMWLNPVSFDGTNFQGVVDNDPEQIKTVKLGQTVTIAPDKISDWMYVDKGKLVGGETLRAMRDELAPAERAEFDKGLPFLVE